MKIAVAGATGRIGRHTVDVLEERGHEVVPMSRTTGVDLVSAEGLEAALAGVERVIDAASTPSPDQAEATEHFRTATRNLHAAGAQAGVHRLVAVSIVGTDRFTAGYGAAKLVHEQEMLDGPLPAQVVRVTQFHEFVSKLVEWGTHDGVVHVERTRLQPVAARAAAEALVDLAVAPEIANDPIPEIAGPREEQLVDLASRIVARRGDALRVEVVSDGVYADFGVRKDGGLLPGRHAVLAGPTFDAWLDATVTAGSAA
ncbi:MAG: SDR family oxidoreductase [Acidimicrobiia bacterium]